MPARLQLGDVTVQVVWKDIKNVHLSVHPPVGKVRLAAPSRMSMENLRLLAIAKLPWIKKQRRRFLDQERETRREYLSGESHYLWGKRYLLTVVEGAEAPFVDAGHQRLVLHVRPGTDEARRQYLFEAWYRDQIRAVMPRLLAKWQPLVGIRVNRVFVQRMRTRWGGCNPEARNIRLNTDLGRKPRECLEYILVHEMTHLLEPKHGERFVTLMDRLMPRWRFIREQLNFLPVRHEAWGD